MCTIYDIDVIYDPYLIENRLQKTMLIINAYLLFYKYYFLYFIIIFPKFF